MASNPHWLHHPFSGSAGRAPPWAEHPQQVSCREKAWVVCVCHPDSGNAKAVICSNYSRTSQAAHIPAPLTQGIRAKQGIPKTTSWTLSPAPPHRHRRANTCHSILEGFNHDAVWQGGGQESHFFPHSAKELLGFWGLELHFLEGMAVCGARREGLKPGDCHRLLLKANLFIYQTRHSEEMRGSSSKRSFRSISLKNPSSCQ